MWLTAWHRYGDHVPFGCLHWCRFYRLAVYTSRELSEGFSFSLEISRVSAKTTNSGSPGGLSTQPDSHISERKCHPHCPRGGNKAGRLFSRPPGAGCMAASHMGIMTPVCTKPSKIRPSVNKKANCRKLNGQRLLTNRGPQNNMKRSKLWLLCHPVVINQIYLIL